MILSQVVENNYLCKPSYANDDDNEKVIDDSGEQSSGSGIDFTTPDSETLIVFKIWISMCHMNLI